MVLSMSEALPIKTGAILVTDGQLYATLDGQSEQTVNNFNEATVGLETAHITCVGDPTACKLLGVVAVPSVFLVFEGRVIGEAVGVCNAAQYKAFVETGVLPC